VQRSLKSAAHLPSFGVDVHVLTPRDTRWLHRDERLACPPGAQVHRTAYVGPRGRRPAEELRGLHGYQLAVRRIALTPRRFLAPDENVPWLLTAVPAAIRIVRRERIDVVLTTSPPCSAHLIGAAVKSATGARWVADLRDSLAANPDRRVDRLGVRLKERSCSEVLRLIARQADAAVAATGTIAAELERLAPSGVVEVIPNGCDFDDFDDLGYRSNGGRFRITHTGSFFGHRDPRPFLSALAQTHADTAACFVGDFRGADLDFARGLRLGDRLTVLPFVPHRRALELQAESEALLLLLPDVGERGRDVPSGKLFEYLAAGRPILAAVPPDGTAAALIREASAGVVVAPGDVDAIRRGLEDLERRWRDGRLRATTLPPQLQRRLDRKARIGELADLLHRVAGTAPVSASSGRPPTASRTA
jgi:glycosyltransferase involved in cell wall biosynthesis